MRISYKKTLRIDVLEAFASRLSAAVIRKIGKYGETAEDREILDRLHDIKNEMYLCDYSVLVLREKELMQIRDTIESKYGKDMKQARF